MSHETNSTPQPQGDFIKYPDGVDEVFRQPGTRFSIDALRNRLLLSPVDYDTGAIVVQTYSPDNGTQVFAFDPHHMIDASRPRQVADLEKFPTSDAAHDITVGERWSSPFGLTDKVVGVAAPYNTKALSKYGVDRPGVEHKPEGSHSQTALGRRRLDEAVPRGFQD